ncbi:MAG: sulfite oxidase [Verrucomicrobiota bacterium]|nr:sulfite oxidase [Verrucomicrobiota bacterium]
MSKLIVREANPPNLETPFETVDSFITPTELFYIRCHFPVPQIASANWRLEISGDVENPCAFTLEELRALPARETYATLECAGNNRSFLEKKVSGVQWSQGAVSNAQWRGVRLADVLARARPRADAIEAIFEGADGGVVEKPGAPSGEIAFSRSLPLSHSNVLLAYEMNGEPLNAAHGFPLRAIVPGWYAMASIKWLRRIIVTSTPFDGYYQTLDYGFWERVNGLPTLRPLREMQVKAQIASPVNGERVTADTMVHVRGAAWGGQIARVEVSDDGGEHWHEAKFRAETAPHAWRLWDYEWRVPKQPGRCVLMARAIDADDKTQPQAHDPDRGSYMINQLLPAEIEIVG